MPSWQAIYECLSIMARFHNPPALLLQFQRSPWTEVHVAVAAETCTVLVGLLRPFEHRCSLMMAPPGWPGLRYRYVALPTAISLPSSATLVLLQQAVADGPDYHLLLGIDPQLLLDAVDRVLDGRGLVAPGLGDLPPFLRRAPTHSVSSWKRTRGYRSHARLPWPNSRHG